MPAYSTIPSSITTLYIFAVVNLVALFHVSCVDADIIVISPLNKTKVYADMPSNFGFALPPSGLSGLLVVADPIDSCSPIAPPPDNMSTYFALIRRSQCDFDIKVLNAQKSGFKAAIVYNVGADNIFPMNPNKHGKDIEIPSVFVGETTGNDLLKFYTHDKG
ncbi:E3 ubiquitin-protein ligase RNF13-like, partial [Saccoglossus kowalevskii]|uniref:E3 ubiquitin-protein ligase RNF13-like n=1 Tax=Saccoglossus kowalevskii TaxID=10224 RepID=A0ABM0MZ04_SACKO